MNFLEALETGLPMKRVRRAFILRHRSPRDGLYLSERWLDGDEIRLDNVILERDDYLATDWMVQLEDGTEVTDAEELEDDEEVEPQPDERSFIRYMDQMYAEAMRAEYARREQKISDQLVRQFGLGQKSRPIEETLEARQQLVKNFVQNGLVSPQDVTRLIYPDLSGFQDPTRGDIVVSYPDFGFQPWGRSVVEDLSAGKIQVIGRQCPGHERVDTGMRKSWCRHCNANMALDYDNEWKVVP
jgi:hypothetical protein